MSDRASGQAPSTPDRVALDGGSARPGRTETADVLVIGGGIIGLCTALEIKRRLDAPRVVLIEKEPALGAHASGRNSGVLHSGFYYGVDSLKARYCREGNQALTEYCLAKHLQIGRAHV